MHEWAVAQAVPGTESRALQDLQALDFTAYLPLASVLRLDGRGRRVVALFPGYLFFEIKDLWEEAFRARRLRGVLGRVPAGVVEGLRQRERPDGLVWVDPPGTRRWKRGQRVRARSGPMVGLEGAVAWCGRERVRVLFDFLGRQTPVSLGCGELSAA